MSSQVSPASAAPLIVPAGSPQVRYWALHQIDPESLAYHLPAAFLVRGKFDVEALRASLSKLVSRHEILRTTFCYKEGAVSQVVASSGQWPMEVLKIEGQEEEIAGVLAQVASRPFDLEEGPLARAVVVSAGGTLHGVCLVLHHAITDAVALSVITEECLRLYEAVCFGQEVALPEVALHYADCSHFASEWLKGPQAAAQREFWRKQLSARGGRFRFRASKPPPVERERRSVRIHTQLSRDLSGRVEALAAQAGATPFMVLLSAVFVLMQRDSGRNDLVVGTPVSGRSRAEMARVVGCFVNTLAIRCECGVGVSFVDLLSRVREATLAAQRHQELPFEQVVEAVGVVRKWDQNPLFDILFGFQPAPQAFSLNGQACEPLSVELGIAKFDWSLLAVADSGGFRLTLDCDADLFERHALQRQLEDYCQIVELAVAKPAQVLAAFEGVPLAPLARELPTRQPDREAESAGLGSPLPEQAAALADLWATVLGVPVASIGEDSNFFLLGGDSVLAMQLVQRARERGWSLKARDVFKRQQFGDMARRVAELAPASGAEQPKVSEHASPDAHLNAQEVPEWIAKRYPGYEAAYPLTSLQQGLLFHTVQAPNEPVYVQQLNFTVRGRLALGRLNTAWQQTLARHPALRNRFVWRESEQPWQVTVPSLPGAGCVLFTDLQDLEPSARELAHRQWIQRDYETPFAMETDELQRLRCVQIGGEEYRLTWTHHHLLVDGWSAGLVLTDLLELYDGGAKANGAKPSRSTLSHKSVVLWQKAREGADSDYWRKVTPSLRTERVLERARRGPTTSSGLGEHRLELSEAQTRRLVALAASQGLTVNSVLLGLWGVSLTRVAARQRVVVGVTLSGRSPELEGADKSVGLFINTLPLALRCRTGGSLSDVLQDVHAGLADLIDHQHTSLSAVAKRAGVAASELFDSLWVFENYPVDQALSRQRHDFQVESPWFRDHSHYALSAVASVGERARLRLSYRRSELDGEWCRSLLRDFEQRLFSFLAEGSGQSELGRYQATERGRWRTVLEAVEQNCTRFPDAVALRQQGVQLSYAGLESRSRRVAESLLASLAQRGRLEVCVALAVPRGIEWVVAVLGIARAGFTYLPLDPDSPTGRNRALIEAAQPDALISQGGHLSDAFCATQDLLHWSLEGLEGDTSGSRASLRPPSRHEHELAYVIYTSGTTGEPKGVSVGHGALSNLVRWHLDAYALRPEDRCSLLAGLGFDASVWELWPTLVAGGCLCFPPPGVRTDPPALLQWLQEEEINVAFVATPIAEPLFSLAWPEMPRLRAVLTGGDRLRVAPKPRPTRLINHYGPTESAVVATAGVVDVGQPGAPAIGRAVGRVTTQICDPWQGAMEDGLTGELLLGGGHLARGYRGDASLTAQRFVPDPTSRHSGARRYRTGDQVWRSETGEIHFVGRMDRQIKLSGARTELAEIESVLLRAQGVSGAMVTVKQTAKGHTELCAYVVVGASVSGAECGALSPKQTVELRQWALQYLPVAAVPARFLALQQLPLTANGKHDYDGLPEVGLEELELTEEISSERTKLQQVLVEVWREVLGTSEIEPTDSFFSLGGDSILSLQLIRVAARRGLVVSAEQIFERPTLAELSEVVTWQARQAPMGETVADDGNTELSSELSYSLGALQEGLFFHAQSEQMGGAKHPSYVEQFVIELGGTVRGNALQQAWGAVVARHEILRTAFVTNELGETRQVVQPLSALPEGALCQVVDCSGLGALEFAECSAQFQRQDRNDPFDWTAPPLARLRLIVGADAGQGSGSTSHLLLTHHHLLMDGWSLALVLRDLTRFYAASLAGFAFDLPPAPAYGRCMPPSEDSAEGAAFWRRELSGFDSVRQLMPKLTAGRGGAACATGDIEVRQHSRELSEEVFSAARQFVLRHGLTLNTLCQAAWALVLGQYAGSDRALFGCTVSGRESGAMGIEQAVGLFVNTLPSPVNLAETQEVMAWLQSLQRDGARRAQRSGSRLSSIQRAVTFERGVGENAALFDVLYVFENYPAERAIAELSDGLEVLGISAHHQTHYPLSLVVVPGESVCFRLGRDVSRLSAPLAERMLSAVEHMLKQLMLSPHSHLGALERFEGRELAMLGQLDTGFASLPLPSTQFVHERFARAAAQVPNAVAVVEGQTETTYAELSSRVLALTEQLVSCGLKPESVVAISACPGQGLIAAVLATLSAGSAFMVLDSRMPDAHQQSCLRQADAKVVVGQAQALGLARTAGCQWINLDQAELSSAKRSQRSVARPPFTWALSADSLAYLLHTSGSTGEAKPVAVCHGSLAGFLQWIQQTRRLTSSDRILHKSPLSFDGALWEVFAPLSVGARCVVANEEQRAQPDEVARLLVEQQISVAQFVPSLLRRVLPQLPAGEGESPLRWLACGGEVLSVELAQQIFEKFPSVTLQNVYGPTEATVDACAWQGTSKDMRSYTSSASIPIGQPVAGARCRVLNAQGHPSPVGATGQLFLAGAGLARGYFGRPAATAEKFLPLPATQVVGERWYATGDQVFQDDSGDLVFVERVDRQVKLRGQRVELAAIEAVALRMPGITAAVATVHSAEPGHERLLLFVAGSTVVRDELAERLRRTLGPGCVPPSIEWRPQIPLSSRGKPNVQQLVASWKESQVRVCEPAASGRGEEALSVLWAQVLGVPQVWRFDNFFDLGGDSILSLQLAGRARAQGWSFGPADLFEHQTVAELASRFEQSEPQSPVVVSVPEARASIELSPIQQWLVEQPGVSLNHYNQSVALEVDTVLDTGRVRQALDCLLNAHSALRLRYDSIANRQSAGSSGQVWPLEVLDSELLSEEEARQQFEEVGARAQASLSLAEGSLVRAVWQCRGEGKANRLLLAVHHWGVDAVSWRLLLEQLAELCTQTEFNSSRIKGSDFTQWARHLQDSGTGNPEMNAALAVAREHYLGLEWDFVQSIPALCPEGLRTNAQGSVCGTIGDVKLAKLQIGEEHTESLIRRIPSELGLSLQDALLASLMSTLREWLGSDTLAVALEGHGRRVDATEMDPSQIVGWFTAIHPLVLRVDSEFSLALRDVRRALLEVPDDGVSYGLLRYGPDQAGGSAMKFMQRDPEISFNYLGQLDATARQTTGWRMVPAPGSARRGEDPRRYVFDVSAFVSEGRLNLQWAYSVRHWEESVVPSLLAKQVEKLEALANEPSAFAPSTTEPPGSPDEVDYDLDAILGELNG